MNQIYFLIINILLYSNFFNLNNCDPVNRVVDYSNLLPLVRIDYVKKVLLVLPGIRFVNILQMCISMAKQKYSFGLNDVESAFLVYQWMIKNLDLKCEATKPQTAQDVYDTGIGNSFGFSILFQTMTYYLNVTSGLIKGYTRNKSNITQLPTEPFDWIWNYILMNNTYYLVDVAFGRGGCNGPDLRNVDDIFFFGTKPEHFIYWNYPYDNKWQLLDEPVPFDVFKNSIVKEFFFYKYGYTSISPENYTLEGGKDEIAITLYYNDIFPNCKPKPSYSFANPITKYITAEQYFNKISDGIFQAKISTKDKKYYKFRVNAGQKCDRSQYSAMIGYYFINHTNEEEMN